MIIPDIEENLNFIFHLFFSFFVKQNLQGSGEYIDSGGVGGVFSLFILGSIIDGRTKKFSIFTFAFYFVCLYLVIVLDHNDMD
jgi:hypothetical protein